MLRQGEEIIATVKRYFGFSAEPAILIELLGKYETIKTGVPCEEWLIRYRDGLTENHVFFASNDSRPRPV